MEIPEFSLPTSVSFPNPIALPRPILNEPAANLPSYNPMVVAPRILAPPQGVPTIKQEELLEEAEKRKEEGEPAKEKPQAAEVRRIDIPFTDLKFPVPKEEILITAGTTASVSVIATLTVTSLFKETVKVMKPIIKQIATRIQKKLNGNSKGKTEEPST